MPTVLAPFLAKRQCRPGSKPFCLTRKYCSSSAAEDGIDALLQQRHDLAGGIDLHQRDLAHVQLVEAGERGEQLVERIARR